MSFLLPGPWWRLNRISVWWSYARQDPWIHGKRFKDPLCWRWFFWGVAVADFFVILFGVFSFRHLTNLTWFRFCVFGNVNWWKSLATKWHFPMTKWFSDVWIHNVRCIWGLSLRGPPSQGFKDASIFPIHDDWKGLLSLGQESWDRGRELMEQHSKPIQEGRMRWKKWWVWGMVFRK